VEFIDTHCHLYADALGRDPAGVLARARAAGVTRVVVPAYDLASWAATAALARLEGVLPALGLHPWVAHEPLDPERLREELRACGAVAVGEIGLDAKIDGADLAQQTRALRAQLAVAVELDLPVLLHCRGAFAELLAVLREFAPALRGVVHAFSRGPDLAEQFLASGLAIAFGGAITRPASRARAAAAALPLARVVLETDAPSIGLQGIDAAAVEPRHVRDVALALAELRGETLEAVAEVTTSHARELFRF
jgi:TatD DNase family protein